MNFDIYQISELLNASVSEWQPAEEIKLTFGRFPNGRSAVGQLITTDLATWAAYRSEQANTLHSGDKNDLQAEAGAILCGDGGGCRRKGEHVAGMTWIFLDSDSGQSGLKLRTALESMQIAHLLTESFSSRHAGNRPKWHLFLPLSQPKTFGSLTLPGVDVAKSLDTRRRWWHAVNAHVKQALCILGELGEERADDVSSDSFPRIAYVPRMPAPNERRIVMWNEGRCLDLDKFLAATGFSEPEPALVMLPAKPAVPAAATSHTEPTDNPAPVSSGPTDGETTGSLLLRVFEYFDMLGSQIGDGKYMVRCPWARNHTATSQHNPDGFDSSVTIWTLDADKAPGGGFKCQHNGGGINRQCCQATAADVLRWARLHGCPLPDRGVTARQTSEVTLPQPTEAPELPPEFPAAPKTATPPRPAAVVLPQKAEKTEIEITEDLAAMRGEAIKALASHPSFYRIEGTLYDLVEQGFDRNGRLALPWVRKSTSAYVRAELTTVSSWYELTPKGEKRPKRPDGEIGGLVLTAGQYPGMRQLNGIITTPVFRRDYTLIQGCGYDQKLGVLYRPSRPVRPVSEDPSREQLVRAKQMLLFVIQDFPFRKGTADIARGVWLAAIFTRFLRFTFTGNIPMFLVAAGAAGSGKGKLIDAAAIISDGAEAWKRTKAGDDAELERAIGAAIKEGASIAVLDNIPRGVILESATLENYLTTPRFSTREIGTSKNIKAEKGGGWDDTLWWATGNALQTGGDMSRRVLRIDIEDSSGKPHERTTTIKGSLEDYCHTKRPELLHAVLTLLSGFFAAKRRGFAPTLPPFASFEGWSLVREAVVWCGLPDPYLARGKADDDVDGQMRANLMTHLYNFAGTEARHLGALCEDLKRDHTLKAPKHADMYEFLREAGVKVDGDAAKSLGRYLKKYDGEVCTVGDKKLQLKTGRDMRGSWMRLTEV